jgi:magnesium chelatase family protein
LEIEDYFLERNLSETGVNNPRPFRTPHHNISLSKFIGGGNPVRAGEVTLAHRGILFMDEFMEFRKEVINSLREPLENKKIMVHTGSKAISLPTEFTLVGATNLCHCGNYGSVRRRCYCNERLRRQYINRIPGPIIDRIPLWSLVDDHVEESKNERDIEFLHLEDLVMKGLSFRQKRLKANGSDSVKSLSADLDEVTKSFLDLKATELNLSRRQIANYTKLARTLADLYEAEVVDRSHISEVLNYVPRITPT